MARPSERLLLICLATHVNKEAGFCWPGKKCLAREMGVSESSIKTYMRSLKNKGLIKVEYEEGYTNRYYLTIPGVKLESSKKKGKTPTKDCPPDQSRDYPPGQGKPLPDEEGKPLPTPGEKDCPPVSQPSVPEEENKQYLKNQRGSTLHRCSVVSPSGEMGRHPAVLKRVKQLSSANGTNGFHRY